ncbi:hypothetical protein [Halorubrum sp. DTA98]|uniref:hypothetical protein n=1 Tax=Halorubrum sp. DTA98 TaxID=3402163 RepID=UPI003AAC6C03
MAWFVGLLGFSILLSWVYNGTGGSILLAMVMHGSINALPGALVPLDVDLVVVDSVVDWSALVTINVSTRHSPGHSRSSLSEPSGQDCSLRDITLL